MSEAKTATGAEAGRAALPDAVERRRKRLRLQAIGTVICLLAAGAIFVKVSGPELSEEALRARPAEAFAAPGGVHRWGTDHEGRDMFARVLVAAGRTAGVAGIVWVVSGVIGALLGMTRCFTGAWMLRPAAIVTRAWFCFPMFVLVAAFVAVSGGRDWGGIGVLCMVGTVMVGRRVAGTLSNTMGHASDRAALASAIPRLRLWKYFRLPHAFYAGYRGAWAVLPLSILWEASLGFIGAEAAVQPLGLGQLVREGRLFYLDAPWLVLIPAAALAILVFLARAFETVIGAGFDRYYSVLDDDE